MQIKTKLQLSLGSLFSLIVFLGILAVWQVQSMGIATKNILENNYFSLQYAQDMLALSEKSLLPTDAAQAFERLLDLQSKNITEQGENQVTMELSDYYQQIKKGDTTALPALRQRLYSLMQINREAIQKKSQLAESEAKINSNWIIVVTGLCAIFSLLLWWLVPQSIFNPIRALDHAKNHFIATISHELKTPIASIKMGLQLLENDRVGAINHEQRSLLEGIKDDANRLLKITSELLNMAQVENGNIQLNIHPSDAKEILDYALITNKMQAEQKQITMQVECPENLPKVLVDSEKTAWVLTNLISNAIRYSDEGASIRLRIFVENKEFVCFSVRDTGKGIAPQYLDKIFNRYFRVPGSQQEGTGLGLAISKEFMEAQGGKISVESTQGLGSTFSLSAKRE